MNLRQEMRAFTAAHEGRDAAELAEMFARGCRKIDLLPLLIEEFKWVIRDNVRALEIVTLRAAAPVRSRRTREAVRASLSELAPLLDKPYRIGDGQLRRFGAMSADEHRTRVLMLRANINGLERDIELHERAITIIEARGASCLDEITDARVAA